MELIKNNKGPFGIAAIVGIGVLGWLAFGFFGIQAAFIDDVVDESGPVFDAAPAVVEDAGEPEPEIAVAAGSIEAEDASSGAAVADAGGDAGPDAEAAAAIAEAEPAPIDEAPEGVALAAEQGEEVVAEEAAVEQAPVEEAPAEETVEAAAPAPEPVEEPVAEEPAEEQNTPGEIVTLASGSFSSLNGYSVSGDASVLNNGTEQRFLRLENFVSDNGPDLKVYLRADNGEFISLGDLTGNIGDQNYEIPVGVDLDVFRNVEIWCERFSAGFGVATFAG